MAFTNSPQVSTYKTVPLPFNGVDQFRSGNLATQRDCQTVNFFYDRVTDENTKRTVDLKKRPGIGDAGYNLTKNASTDTLRGSHYDPVQNAMYWCVNNHVYQLKPDASVNPTLLGTINTSSGYCGFDNYVKSTGVRYVVMSDGTDLWIHDYGGATFTRVTDADMPTPHVPTPLSFDGYILLIKSGTNTVYNSDADNPTSWTAGNFFSVEINADQGLNLFRAQNYVVVAGYSSMEFFYDAANATGSPFSRNESPYRSVGFVTGKCTIGDTTYFVGQDAKKNMQVFSLFGFKIDPISTPIVNSTLQAYASAANTKGQVNLNQDGYCISVDGHTFYILVTPQTTWAYDVEEKFWYEFKGSDNTGLKIEAAWSMRDGAQYLAITNQSTMSIMSPSLYQDFGLNFTCRYTTDNYTADTLNFKTCNRIILFCDQTNNVGTSLLNVTWSDDDWAGTASGGTRTVNVFNSTPDVRQCGRFRSRSWRFEYSDNYPLRITSAYLDLNVGTM